MLQGLFKKPKSISQKMLAAIFITSSLVTFIITSVQISFDYFQEMSTLKKNVSLVEKSYLQSIALSLWELRYSQLQTQLNGIVNIPGVLNVQVVEQNKIVAKSGKFTNGKTLINSFYLTHYDPNTATTATIGKLVVTANVDEVLDKILQKVLLIFVTQFIKTLLVSFLIYLCIQHLITKHLIHISQYLRELQLNTFDKSLSLNRKKSEIENEDELDTLVYSINEMREKINQSYRELTLFNKELEEKVESKTQLILDQRLKLEYSAKMTILGEMAGGIAHEINNPITIISGINRIMRKSFEKGVSDPAVYHKCFDDIDSTVIRISKIITGLRIVSRDGSNEDFQTEVIADIFNDVLALCREKFKNGGITLEANLEEEIFKTTITCSRVQLSQVFLNLLGNSYDAIEGSQDKWIKIQCYKEDGLLVIKFTDSGNGIPAHIQEKIFQPFYTTKAIGKGTGLGLSISNSIIKVHSGKFAIDNTSINTCFIISLPIKDENQCLTQAI